MFFWNSLAFSMIQQILAIWFLVPLPFLIPAWTMEVHSSCTVETWLGEFWELDECNCVVGWRFFGIPFLWDWNADWPLIVLWPLLSFPDLLAIECSTFTASSFRIWNSSTGIPSPPLALFIVMIPKAHLGKWHFRNQWTKMDWDGSI